MASSADTKDLLLWRLRVLTVAMLGGFVVLGVVLWRVQVMNTSEYEDSLDRQSIRRTRIPGARGRILDRNRECLADNRPSYCIAIYVEELRQSGRLANTVRKIDGVIDELAGRLGLTKEVAPEDIRSHVIKRRPLPFIAWKDISRETLARLAESRATFEGVDVYVEPVRVYPQGAGAAHVLGYVGRAAPEQDSEEPYHFYLPEMEGKDGVEKVMNAVLSGTAGGRLIRVDASGYKHGDLGGRDPTPGEDVVLAMDSRVQKRAEECLSTNRGAMVVMDPRNGDLLALASAPAYDPNSFSRNLKPAEWKQLKADKRKVLLNRAIAEIYAPGSAFKPVVALAALENRCAGANTSFGCPGVFHLGSTPFHCWRKSGHGTLDMTEALEQSCNVYFCQLGLMCGQEKIFHMAEALGLGSRTGIELETEEAGVLPSDAWKRKTFHDAWRPGDTCNISIGQGMLAVTPLQMAVITSAIANGGKVYRPRLILEPQMKTGRFVRHDFERQGGNEARVTKGDLIRDLRWSAETVKVLKKALYGVVNDSTGTGKRAKIPGVEIAGKTGTAEYGKKEEGKKYTWMVAFAPVETPRYAAVIVIEDGVSGGVTAAPCMRKMMAGLFGVSETGEGQPDTPSATGTTGDLPW